MKTGMHPNSLSNLTRSPRKGNRYSYSLLARMTRRMMMQKFTITMLAKYADISWGGASSWTKALHSQKCIHICEYLRSPSGRTTERVYQWGVGDDVQRPEKSSKSATQARYRARKKTLEFAMEKIARRSLQNSPAKQSQL